MPVMTCSADGKSGYKWGDQGKCYTYTAGDEQSRTAAENKAKLQGRAIEANKIKFDVVKVDESNNTAFGWAYVAVTKKGEQVFDASGEYITDIDALEAAAYAFNIAYRKSGELHRGDAKGYLIDSFMVTKEKLRMLGLPEDSLPQGLWVGFYFPDDEVFEKIQSGKYKMFSIQGKAVKEVTE